MDGAVHFIKRRNSMRFNGFSKDSFVFFHDLKENNSVEWMHANDHKNQKRYMFAVREPLRNLFIDLSPLILQMDPSFETEVKTDKILSKINKRNITENDAYYPYYWGAFYRKGRKRQNDCQLILGLSEEGFDAGCIVAGIRGNAVLENFYRNLEMYPEVFIELVNRLDLDFSYHVAKDHGRPETELAKFRTKEDLQELFNNKLIKIIKKYEPSDPRLYSSGLVNEVMDIFRNVYPIFRFATGDDKSIISLLDKRETINDLPLDFTISLSAKQKVRIIFSEYISEDDFDFLIKWINKLKNDIVR
jgi:uncharacterized protein (DUF2461 family)